MDQLTPNPDGCPRFEPNQFKKEKCKNCGRPWQEHLGVITEAQVDVYMGAIKKAAAEKEAKEAKAKAEIKAKAAAKKKAQQAVEDDWLNDGQAGAADADEESDDDMGFRMFSASELQKAPIDSARKSVGALKVKNLIDFDECDVGDDEAPAPHEPSSSSASAPPEALPPKVSSSNSLAGDAAPPPRKSMSAGSGLGGSFGQDQNDLLQDFLGQIEHLRQQLSDANEEKNIQVAIVQDEVVEKQQIIEELKRKSAETEATCASLTRQLAEAQASPSSDAAATSSADAEELQRLRTEVEELRLFKTTQEQAGFAPEAAAGSSSPPTWLPAAATLISELHGVCGSTQQALDKDAVEARSLDSAEVEADPEAALRQLRDLCISNQSAAQRSTEEHRRLTEKLSETESSAAQAIKAAAAAAAAVAAPVSAPDASANKENLQSDEAQATAQAVSRQAAQALREVRLNAERQLAWITKRIKLSQESAAPLNAVGVSV